MTDNQAQMTFWDHLDVLRGVLWRAIAVVAIVAVAMFVAMPAIFDSVVLGPCHSGFITYRIIDRLAETSGCLPDFVSQPFDVDLINIKLASQFFIHLSTSFWLALVVAAPVLVYLVWTFVSPALYVHERRGVSRAFFGGCIMFYIGVAVGYFVVFPVTLRFLADYRLSADVPNMLSLESYMDNFTIICLVMGLVFELPLLAWMLGRLGIINRTLFNTYRRHAIVALLILAAVITPTGDPFTLMVVFLPIYALWELGGRLVPRPDDKT